MSENVNALKAESAKINEHLEVQKLDENVNIKIKEELLAACDSSTEKIATLRKMVVTMMDKSIDSEIQIADLIARLEQGNWINSCHKKALENRINSLEAELVIAKVEADKTSSLQLKFNNLQSQLEKIEPVLASSRREATFKATEIRTLKVAMKHAKDEVAKNEKKTIALQSEFNKVQTSLKKSESNAAEIRTLKAAIINAKKEEAQRKYACQSEINKLKTECIKLKSDLLTAKQVLKSKGTGTTLLEYGTLNAKDEEPNKGTTVLEGEENPSTPREGMKDGKVDDSKRTSLRFTIYGSELTKIKSDLSSLYQETCSKAAEIATLREAMKIARDEETRKISLLQMQLKSAQCELDKTKSDLSLSRQEVESKAAKITSLRAKIKKAKEDEVLKDNKSLLESHLHSLQSLSAKIVSALPPSEKKVRSPRGEIYHRKRNTYDNLEEYRSLAKKMKKDN